MSQLYHTRNNDSYLATPVTNILYVDNKRTDTYIANGAITKPFKTIQAAIDAITNPSSTNKYLIEIAPGAYYSAPITVNKIYTTFRSCGLNGARISGKITIINPSDPTPEQITFVGLRISGGLECLASHICINAVDCNVTGSDWVMNPTTPTDDEYLQVFSGIWYANATLTNVYTYLVGGGYYSTFTASGKEFNINNSDINEPFEAILSGTLVGSAFGNRAGNSKFTLNAEVNLHIDADTEGGSIITIAGGTLTRSTKGGNILNDSSVTGTTVKNALETLGLVSHTPNTDTYLNTQITHRLYVDKNRTDTYTADGSFTKPFITIQAAINAISGATDYNRFEVLIAPGQYTEQITMKNYVHLVGLIADSVFIISDAGDVVTSSVTANMSNLMIMYNGSDSSKVGLKLNNGAILITTDVYLNTQYSSIEVNNGAALLAYGGATLTGDVADSAIVRNGGYALFSGINFSGYGAPAYDLTIEAGGYVDLIDVQLYSERINNLGTLNLKTPASRINNDSAVTGTTTKDALDTLNTNKYSEGEEIKIKVYSQNSEPTLSADQKMAMWIDTDDSNRVYLLFRRGSGDQVGVELL